MMDWRYRMGISGLRTSIQSNSPRFLSLRSPPLSIREELDNVRRTLEELGNICGTREEPNTFIHILFTYPLSSPQP